MDFEKIINENSILESDRLILRPFQINDVQNVYCYAKDNDVTKYLNWFPHKNIEETKKIITELYINNIGTYAIELKSKAKCIGCFELRLCVEHDKASFGYVLNKNYWNNGYMSEALNLIIKFCFEKLQLNRIESNYYVGNEASGKVMKKCGMIYEGIGKDEVKIKGKFHDVVHYAILKDQNNKKY